MKDLVFGTAPACHPFDGVAFARVEAAFDRMPDPFGRDGDEVGKILPRRIDQFHRQVIFGQAVNFDAEASEKTRNFLHHGAGDGDADVVLTEGQRESEFEKTLFPGYIYAKKFFRGNFKSIWRNDLKKLFEEIISGAFEAAARRANSAENRPGRRCRRAFQSNRQDF